MIVLTRVVIGNVCICSRTHSHTSSGIFCGLFPCLPHLSGSVQTSVTDFIFCFRTSNLFIQILMLYKTLRHTFTFTFLSWREYTNVYEHSSAGGRPGFFPNGNNNFGFGCWGCPTLFFFSCVPIRVCRYVLFIIVKVFKFSLSSYRWAVKKKKRFKHLFWFHWSTLYFWWVFLYQHFFTCLTFQLSWSLVLFWPLCLFLVATTSTVSCTSKSGLSLLCFEAKLYSKGPSVASAVFTTEQVVAAMKCMHITSASSGKF